MASDQTSDDPSAAMQAKGMSALKGYQDPSGHSRVCLRRALPDQLSLLSTSTCTVWGWEGLRVHGSGPCFGGFGSEQTKIQLHRRETLGSWRVPGNRHARNVREHKLENPIDENLELQQ